MEEFRTLLLILAVNYR